VTVREALAICSERDHLRRTIRIALVVGTILTLINQLDIIVNGTADALTWVKCGLNYCVPFIVSNLGLLAGRRADLSRDERSAADQRAGVPVDAGTVEDPRSGGADGQGAVVRDPGR
jgi:hypothetical protein